MRRIPLSVIIPALLMASASAPGGAVVTRVVTTTADSASGSLRQAIEMANSQPIGVETLIVFDIVGDGPHVIQPQSPLPTIARSVSIDGTSQTGYQSTPLIVLDGTRAGISSDLVGLRLTGGGSSVRGLALNGWRGAAIEISGPGGSVVEMCHIGTDATGLADGDGSQATGVHLLDSPNNQIGGAGVGNLISGNTVGVEIEGASSSGNRVIGNLIGTDATGLADLGNSTGVEIKAGAAANTVGGTLSGEGNVISGNRFAGIEISGSDLNLVIGNLIGLGADGLTPLGNEADGIRLTEAAADNTVGGIAVPARNVISGNTAAGVAVAGADGNEIQGNFIGTDATGLIAVGNGSGVVLTDEANGNRIGGTAMGPGNLISGNVGSGVILAGGAVSNRLEGNLIGTDATGSAALPNLIGVQFGSTRGGAIDNVLGGPVAGAGNVISGNENEGIRVQSLSAVVVTANNRIQGNLIGLASDGVSPLANGFEGVNILSGSDNLIGGMDAGNVIAHNGREGISIAFAPSDSQRNTLRGNRIFNNGTLGIDLAPAGVTDNDVGDSDTGPNTLQNFPVLGSASSSAGGIDIAGSIDSQPNTDFLVEVFLNPFCDLTGFGEGAVPLGTVMVTTGGNGMGSFNLGVPGPLPAGRHLTATATDPQGNTSEFSSCLIVDGLGPTLEEIIAVLLGLTSDPGDLDLNADGAIDIADAVTLANSTGP